MWNIQTLISQIFIHYWQRSNAFDAIFERFEQADLSVHVFRKERLRSQRTIKAIYSSIAFLIPIYLIFLIITKFFINITYAYTGSDHVYMDGALVVIRSFASYLNGSTQTVSMHYYMCFTNALYWEGKTYNWLLKKLNFEDRAKMKVELEVLLVKHTRLSRTLRCVDKVFTVYSFLMICTNVPTFMFLFIRLLTRDRWGDILHAIPGAIIYTYTYLGLTVVPARMQGELYKAKPILCANEAIWVPHDSEVNRLARTLAMHFDQSDLGISLWGFALVSKPFILTTFSVMLTLLAFFLEFKRKTHSNEEVGNERNGTNLFI